MGYRHAVTTMPKNLARLVNAATYDSPVPQGRQPSADYEETMRRRDAREFWDSAVTTTTPTGRLLGSRYQGGFSFPARSR